MSLLILQTQSPSYVAKVCARSEPQPRRTGQSWELRKWVGLNFFCCFSPLPSTWRFVSPLPRFLLRRGKKKTKKILRTSSRRTEDEQKKEEGTKVYLCLTTPVSYKIYIFLFRFFLKPPHNAPNYSVTARITHFSAVVLFHSRYCCCCIFEMWKERNWFNNFSFINLKAVACCRRDYVTLGRGGTRVNERLASIFQKRYF